MALPRPSLDEGDADAHALTLTEGDESNETLAGALSHAVVLGERDSDDEALRDGVSDALRDADSERDSCADLDDRADSDVDCDMLGEPLALRDVRPLREGVTESDSVGVGVKDELLASEDDAAAERDADRVADTTPLALFVSDALPLVEGELVGDTSTVALSLLELEASPDDDAHAETLFDTLALAV